MRACLVMAGVFAMETGQDHLRMVPHVQKSEQVCRSLPPHAVAKKWKHFARKWTW